MKTDEQKIDQNIQADPSYKETEPTEEIKVCDYCGSDHPDNIMIDFSSFGLSMTICEHHPKEIAFWMYMADLLYGEWDEEGMKNKQNKVELDLVKKAIPKITDLVIAVKNDEAIYQLGYLAGYIE